MLIRREYCYKCVKEVDFHNGQCPDCVDRLHREKMAAWQALTIEEKLLDIHKRLLKLETETRTYA